MMDKLMPPRIGCYDVDDTLIRWFPEKNNAKVTINDVEFGINERVVEALVKAKKAGWYVIVWSQAGPEWAEKVVEALHLEPFVDLVMSKPRYVVDDERPNSWLKWFDSRG